ncbi:hypothetical protein MKX03_036791 [Papaver bracteatum]|nr:hypothetical protein MKX03_036791 [Papaver bracteatum]
MEMSSKKPVRRFREVIQFPKKVTRDPRFESLSWELDTDGFRKRYNFLFESKLPAEKEELRKLMKKSNDPKVIADLKSRISSIDKQLKAGSAKRADTHILRNHKKKEREAAKQGKQPYYLKQSLSAAKGTGLKALEFALSICDSVDMYCFTVDPGYTEWTRRYFSESRKGHSPLHGRAYYQMMECLGLVKIHSPMRADRNSELKWLPSQSTINAARLAAEKVLSKIGARREDPLRSCSIIKKQHKGMTMTIPGIRKAAKEHLKYVEVATTYPLEKSRGHGTLCSLHSSLKV